MLLYRRTNINMSSEILTHDHMVSALITPWHGLGTVSDRLLTPDEAYIAAKLDYEVTKHPAFTRVRGDANFQDIVMELVVANATKPDLSFAELLAEIGWEIPIEDKFATVRRDIDFPFGVVGKDYTTFDNSAAFELINALGADTKVETAGSLSNGRKCWALVKMDNPIDLGGSDKIKPYLLFIWSHDGTSAVRIIPTPIRVVCANTLRMALAGAMNAWSSSHTSSLPARAKAAAETLRRGKAYYDTFETEVAKLIDLSVTELQFEDILLDMVPDPEKASSGEKPTDRKLNNAMERRGEIRNLYHNDVRVNPFTGTGWGVLQAFSTHDLWFGRVHGGETKRLERQANRILTGDTMTTTAVVQKHLAALAA